MESKECYYKYNFYACSYGDSYGSSSSVIGEEQEPLA